jgi:RNA polymerase sigma factor, sigma-70 family
MKRKQLFEKFITQNLDNIYRFAYIYVHNRQDAEDIVNDSVIKALKSIHSLKNEEFMKTWFFRIITNTAYTYIKRRKKLVLMNDEVLENCDSSFDDYSHISFEEMIQKLPLSYRSIIVLRFFEDLKISEIAEVLDINENTIKTRLYKALEILKSDMEGDLR